MELPFSRSRTDDSSQYTQLADRLPNSGAGTGSQTRIFNADSTSISGEPSNPSLGNADGQSAFQTRLNDTLSQLPQAGETFLGFNLLRELGRGACGRVFLAEQQGLANRRIVLKVSAQRPREIDSLARLQHTNIVPVHSVHHAKPLHAICMPYLGEFTLNKVVKELRDQSQLPTSGRFILHQLPQEAHKETAQSLDGMPRISSHFVASDDTLQAFRRRTYVEAVLWIIARLADGLNHAHENKIIHCDLKPANVLFTDRGEPLLLDFDVALDMRRPGAAAMAEIGGTLPYMSPDQFELFLGKRDVIDARSDIYSLGLIMFELLAGRLPFDPPQDLQRDSIADAIAIRQKSPTIRKINPMVSPTVESILRKCLEADPEKRYQTAWQLRDDIERQLNHLRLMYASDRSVVEGMRKWARRNPRLSSPLTIVTLLMFCVLFSGFMYSRHLDQARNAQLDADRQAAMAGFRLTMPVIEQRQLELAAGTKTDTDWDRLQSMVQSLIHRSGIDTANTQVNWDSNPDIIYLPDNEKRQLKLQLGVLIYLMNWRELEHVRTHRTDTIDQLSQRFALAEICLQEDAPTALSLQQQLISAARSQSKPDLKSLKPAGFTDLVLTAAQLSSVRKNSEAINYLRDALTIRQNDPLAWLLLGYCQDRSTAYPDAIGSYSAAIALKPHVSAIYYLRCLSQIQLRNSSLALKDIDQAIRFDPASAEYRIRRSLIYLGLRQYQDGIKDLDQVLGMHQPPVKAYLIRSRLHRMNDQAELAEQDVVAGMQLIPVDSDSWLERGIIFAQRKEYRDAIEAFQNASELDPNNWYPLLNQASVEFENLHLLDEALNTANKGIELFPDATPFYLLRAKLNAELKNVDKCLADIRHILKVDHRPVVSMQVAECYTMLAAMDEKYAEYAVEMLAFGLRNGLHINDVLNNTSFASIQHHNSFIELIRAARTLNDPLHRN
ncbi:MAG: serine/threonine-protein kinase [Zavarzinella sp.]